MNGDCGFCLSPGVWLLQKKFQTLTCTCKRVYLFIYIHSFTISFQWCYCCIKWHYSGSKQLFKQLGFLRAMVCLSLQLYCFTKAESKQDLWERERDRIHTKGRVGGEGRGAYCAHDGISVVVREGASLQARFSFSLLCLCFIQKKKGGSRNRVFWPFSWKPLRKLSW